MHLGLFVVLCGELGGYLSNPRHVCSTLQCFYCEQKGAFLLQKIRFVFGGTVGSMCVRPCLKNRSFCSHYKQKRKLLVLARVSASVKRHDVNRNVCLAYCCGQFVLLISCRHHLWQVLGVAVSDTFLATFQPPPGPVQALGPI